MSIDLCCLDSACFFESDIHALRDCSVTMAVWKLLVPFQHWRQFFTFGNTSTWLDWNLSQSYDSTIVGVTWPIVFRVTCY